jgi:transformation/transcription domain-associated protein
LNSLRSYDMSCIFKSLSHLIYTQQPLAYSLWCQVFPICWQLVSATERHTLVKFLIPLLAKDYHVKQIGVRSNVVQALMEGISKCVPTIQLPPQLVKYLSKTFNSWYSGVELLESATAEIRQNGINNKDEEKIRESTLDALAELYSDIGEEDYFFGLWRRRCLFTETNSALSFEQTGLWEQGQVFFEVAQQKARTGIIPFTESEYNLWEDHWIQCAQRLQQWDILTDLSKHECNYDLLIECAWRSSDWVAEKESIQQTLAGVSDNNPRKTFFEIFKFWHKLQGEPDKAAEFQRLLDGGVQSCLKKWASLPEIVTNTHIPLLHQFQLMVELQEASTIQANLASTNISNVDQKNSELKSILQIWRDRLPNMWDDINIWSDLVAWRQHVFGVINKAYSPLLPALTTAGSNSQVIFLDF